MTCPLCHGKGHVPFDDTYEEEVTLLEFEHDLELLLMKVQRRRNLLSKTHCNSEF